MFACVVTLGEERHDCFLQCSAGADVVQAHMWCVVTLGQARHDCFPQCNAGADVAQAHMWCVVTLGEARHDCFPQSNAGGEAIERLSHVAGVGQCASLTVRKCVDPCVLTINLNAQGCEN